MAAHHLGPKPYTLNQEFRWKCETVTNPTEVGRMHKEQEAKKTPLAEDGLDERTKHHARKEKKRLQEQKRRQVPHISFRLPTNLCLRVQHPHHPTTRWGGELNPSSHPVIWEQQGSRAGGAHHLPPPNKHGGGGGGGDDALEHALPGRSAPRGCHRASA